MRLISLRRHVNQSSNKSPLNGSTARADNETWHSVLKVRRLIRETIAMAKAEMTNVRNKCSEEIVEAKHELVAYHVHHQRVHGERANTLEIQALAELLVAASAQKCYAK